MEEPTNKMPPPTWNELEFACWVPTITGHLSFSEIGKPNFRFPYTVKCYNRLTPLGSSIDSAENSFPHIALFQRRPNREFFGAQRLLGTIGEFSWVRWPKSLNKFRFFNFLNSHISRFFKNYLPSHSTSFYVLEGYVSPSKTPYDTGNFDCSHGPVPVRDDTLGVLHGKIHIVRKGSLSENWTLAQKFTAFSTTKTSETSKANWMAFQEELEKNSRNSISFLLFRTGELRLKRGNEELPSEFESDENRTTAPAQQVKQAYYFLKDCAHHHYHHNAHADQLLRVTNVGPEDLAWRRETLWDLSRAIIKMRRERQLFRRKDAVGVIAYAEAFQNILARVRRENDDFSPVPELATYNYTNLKESISSENDSESYRSQGSASLFIAGFAAILTLSVLHHSASSMVLASKTGDICILNQEITFWLGITVVATFTFLWDRLFNRNSVTRRIGHFFRNLTSSFSRSKIGIGMIILLGIILIYTASLNKFEQLDVVGFSISNLTNNLCLL